MVLNLTVLEKTYSIYKFKNESALPDWVYLSEFYSITKTKDELSVVTSQNNFFSEEISCNRDWRILKIEGPLDFSLIGILAEITKILSEKEISVFTISTYNTDYVLVKQNNLNSGIKALKEKGHNFSIKL
jgi:uncharacterized protein